jgi:CheY-like chemotaxis protein
MDLCQPSVHKQVSNQLKADSFEQVFRRYRGLVQEQYLGLTDGQADYSSFASPPVAVPDQMPNSSSLWFVDDNPDVSLIMKRVFGQVNPRIAPAFFSGGDELLSKLNTTPVLPKVILLDLFMTRMNGFETLRRVRTHAPHLPVIILTSSISEEDRARALALGANEFVTKPLLFDQTLSMVHRLVKKWL